MIVRLTPPVDDADLRALAELLVEAVNSGDAVSFLAPLSIEAAEDWWRTTIAKAHPRSIFLIARSGAGVVGAVQLHPAWAPNQPHRAEVSKLLVRRDSRGKGLGGRLMQAVEQEAGDAGFSLLTLDAKRGGAADRLYQRLGWTRVGAIPGFALDPDGGAMHDAVLYYKLLGRSEGDGAMSQ